MRAKARDFRLVFVMAAAQNEARAIARALVEEKLAACVNILGPANSIYRWRGAIESADEFMLVIKTRAHLLTAMERRVRELHSYEVPEIIATALARGSRPYLEWLAESTAPPPSPARAGGRRRLPT